MSPQCEWQDGHLTNDSDRHALHWLTIKLRGSTVPWMIFVSRVSRVGLLYTRSTSSGAVFRCLARSNECTEGTKENVTISFTGHISNLKAHKRQRCVYNHLLYVIFTFFLGVHKKCMLVFLFAVCIQKMELSFQPLNFLKVNDEHTKITEGIDRGFV